MGTTQLKGSAEQVTIAASCFRRLVAGRFCCPVCNWRCRTARRSCYNMQGKAKRDTPQSLVSHIKQLASMRTNNASGMHLSKRPSGKHFAEIRATPHASGPYAVTVPMYISDQTADLELLVPLSALQASRNSPVQLSPRHSPILASTNQIQPGIPPRVALLRHWL